MPNVLERGNLYFLYRPRARVARPESREEIPGAYLVISPDAGGKYRLIVLGRKQLPEIVPGQARAEELAIIASFDRPIDFDLRGAS